MLVVLEILSLLVLSTYVRLATIAYTLAGIAISMIPLLADKGKEGNYISGHKRNWILHLIYIATTLIVCNWILNAFRANLQNHPLDIHISDTPIYLKEMANRYLMHKPVYAPISTIWGISIDAVYLPAFWIPYVIPVDMGIDSRWANLIFLIGAVLVASLVKKDRFNTIYFFLLPAVVLFIYVLLGEEAHYLMYSQEAIVVFYVSLLACALIYENWFLAGMAAALCIMSRYFIGAPLVGGIVWLYFRDSKAANQTVIGTLGTLIFLLTITRTWGDIGHFFQIPRLYYNMLGDVNNFNNDYSVYIKSVGFGSFLKTQQVKILTSTNTAIIVLVPLCFFFLAHKFLSDRKKGLIILCGIKLFLVLFLTTLTIPFGSVLYTSSIVSIILMRSLMTEHLVKSVEN